VKVLVTGASGFLGSHIGEAFADAGHQVRTLLRKTSSRSFLQFPHKEAIGDVTDAASLPAAVADVDAVVHAAGLIKARNEAEFASVNEHGTTNLLRAIAAHNPGLRRFIHISSIAAHGPSPDGRPRPAGAPANPLTAYGRSKLAGEIAVQKSPLAGRSVIFRPPAIYGPRDQALLPFFQLAKWHFAPLLEGGHNRTSMIYGPDCAQAALLAATAEADVGGKIYCPEDGVVYTWRDLLSVIEEAAGKKMLAVPAPRFAYEAAALASELFGKVTQRAVIFDRGKVREMSQNAWVCSADALRADLGWRPRVLGREGAKLTYAWYRANRWL
jgi:nucleoside-diphosphate-sugar epimerase